MTSRENIETAVRPRLDEPSVVDRIIRDWTINALDTLTKPGALARLDFECLRMNNLFLGVTPSDEFERGPWNTPEQLGTYILQALRIDGEDRLAVRDAFMWYIDKVTNVYKPGDEFDAVPIEPLINQLRDALIGVSKGPYGYANA
ncbi:hypothetical protein [Paraburkholderia haematera]|uniref:Uncharacterized protein n=1 Tax=Paraburkholderia haematera TaxID=2793077 RepID=A0ABN7KY51_9BURK|nr:hypothetical protein [Paraburkholderia haematera]CAE6714505.1 hypothetical protein R69888_01308 [Paraburkholderia haematera]